MLGSILGIATGGLKTSQDLIGTVSRNISNATTPGYSKKTQTSQANVWTGGVLTGSVQRAVNESLTRKVNQVGSNLGQLKAELGPLEELDSEIGDPQSATSLASRITALANAYQAYATDPSHSVTGEKVIGAAQDVADTFKTLDTRLRTMASDATEQLRLDVDKINEITDRLAKLNREVSSGLGTGRDVTDLQDEQDSLIAELSGYMNVRTFRNDDGIMSVFTPDNRMLVEIDARKLYVVADTNLGADLVDPSDDYPVMLLQIDDPVAHGQDADGTFRSAVGRLGGSVGGHLNIINDVVPSKLAELDALADTMATQFLSLYDDTVMGPAPALHGLFTRSGATYDPLDPMQKHGLAGKLTINDTIAADPRWLRGDPAITAAGDTTLLVRAQNLLQNADMTITVNGKTSKGTLESLAGGFHAGIADAVSLRRDKIDAQESVHNEMAKKLSDNVGVNMDDEMSRLILLQNMYSANARMITAVDEMYEALFNAIR